MTKLFKNYLLRFMPTVSPPTTLAPLVPSQATDGQRERELWTTPASGCVLLPRSKAWHSNQFHFSPLAQKERHRRWWLKALVRFTQRKAKRNTRNRHTMPSLLQKHKWAWKKSKICIIFRGKKEVMLHTWQDLAGYVTEAALEMLSYQINSSWLGCEPCHIYWKLDET